MFPSHIDVCVCLSLLLSLKAMKECSLVRIRKKKTTQGGEVLQRSGNANTTNAPIRMGKQAGESQER